MVLAAPLFGQHAELRPAELVRQPGFADSNSPAHWAGGKFFIYNSDGMPVLSEGADQFDFKKVRAVALDNWARLPLWIEATWMDRDGTLYAWYHHEDLVCENLSAPSIGAMVSVDGGQSYSDLGIVLADGFAPDCSAGNGYFAGGHGDFTVLLDPESKYFYFYFSNYGGPGSTHGVAVARMAFEDRNFPSGAVWKFRDGEWEEPGIGGLVTPVLPARTPWSSSAPNALWGPSLHYNTFLGTHVMLLNHACCEPRWPAAGIWVSFNRDLGNPAGWSAPAQILEGGGWYPQVIGLEPGGTDKLAGQVARFYMGSDSSHEIVFHH